MVLSGLEVHIVNVNKGIEALLHVTQCHRSAGDKEGLRNEAEEHATQQCQSQALFLDLSEDATRGVKYMPLIAQHGADSLTLNGSHRLACVWVNDVIDCCKVDDVAGPNLEHGLSLGLIGEDGDVFLEAESLLLHKECEVPTHIDAKADAEEIEEGTSGDKLARPCLCKPLTM